jgi:double-GTPase-like protein
MSANGGAAESRTLCLWGPSSVGKTALLAQLFHFGNRAGTDWEVLPAAAAQEFVETTRQRMREENRFPLATGATSHSVHALGYYFRHRTRDVVASLVVEDRAGAQWEAYDPIAEQLRAAQGLVLLLDATFEPARLEGYLARTLQRLAHSRGDATRRDPRPIAVCLSKADLWIRTPEELISAMAEPDAFVRRWLDGRCLASLATYCERFCLFPVSAIGVRLRWGAVEPTVFVDEHGVDRLCPHTRPVNLLEPFAWVLDQLLEP